MFYNVGFTQKAYTPVSVPARGMNFGSCSCCWDGSRDTVEVKKPAETLEDTWKRFDNGLNTFEEKVKEMQATRESNDKELMLNVAMLDALKDLKNLDPDFAKFKPGLYVGQKYKLNDLTDLSSNIVDWMLSRSNTKDKGFYKDIIIPQYKEFLYGARDVLPLIANSGDKPEEKSREFASVLGSVTCVAEELNICHTDLNNADSAKLAKTIQNTAEGHRTKLLELLKSDAKTEAKSEEA